MLKTTFRTKFGRGLGQGASKKIQDPLFISATVEAGNFKFSTQLGLGEYLGKLAGVWARER